MTIDEMLALGLVDWKTRSREIDDAVTTVCAGSNESVEWVIRRGFAELYDISHGNLIEMEAE